MSECSLVWMIVWRKVVDCRRTLCLG